jgi:hypothetical protein
MTFLLRSDKVPGRYNVVDHVGHDEGVLCRGAIHQLLNIILKLRILVLSPVSNLPFVVKVKNYSLIGE